MKYQFRDTAPISVWLPTAAGTFQSPSRPSTLRGRRGTSSSHRLQLCYLSIPSWGNICQLFCGCALHGFSLPFNSATVRILLLDYTWHWLALWTPLIWLISRSFVILPWTHWGQGHSPLWFSRSVFCEHRLWFISKIWQNLREKERNPVLGKDLITISQ